VTPGEVRDVLQARSMVEGWAAARVAATGAPPGLLAELEACVERQRLAAADGDQRAFQEADRQFHHAIVRAAGNTLFTAFHATLRDRQLRMGAWASSAAPLRQDSILAEHSRLVVELAAGDADAAPRLSDHHLDATRAALADRPAATS
jgi:DNA-binding GntR family transcriptional regulator